MACCTVKSWRCGPNHHEYTLVPEQSLVGGEQHVELVATHAPLLLPTGQVELKLADDVPVCCRPGILHHVLQSSSCTGSVQRGAHNMRKCRPAGRPR